MLVKSVVNLASFQCLTAGLALVVLMGCPVGSIPMYYDKTISHEEIAQLKGESQFQLMTYRTPLVMVALPGGSSAGFGKGPLLGGTSRFPGRAYAVSEEEHMRMRSWLGGPTVRLRDRFFTLLGAAIGLNAVAVMNVAAERYELDDHEAPAKPELITFDFRIAEWGLYYLPPDQYLLQLVGRARLLRPGAANPRWSGICVIDAGAATFFEWTNNEGELLRSKLDVLIDKCAKELLGKIVRN